MESYKKPDRENVSNWYIDIIQQAKLYDYGPVKGTMVLRPYGFSIWKAIQQYLGAEIEKNGCYDTYFPSLIPESFITKEKEHIEGFSPELALITYAGGEKLSEPITIRPTSETIMYSYFSKWIQSWRDLPLKINQWVNIVRWEKRNLPFIRGTEFLWHEAHTAHATEIDADEQIKSALSLYKRFFEEFLAIPVITGKKTPSQKFAGAAYSTSCEALLIDGKGLQIGTVHNLGQNFSKSFDIKFMNVDNNENYVWQTSWGISTRALGGLILTHGDEKGLVLPPKVAPIQVVIVPIWKNEKEKTDIQNKTEEVLQTLKLNNIRAESDFRNEKPGWKFNDWEMRGVPIRIEIGPKDVENNSVILARRDNRAKNVVKNDNLIDEINNLLIDIQHRLFNKAQKFVEDNTHYTDNYKDFSDIIENKSGFVSAYWCGDDNCEKSVKDETKATTRCIPFDNGTGEGTCIYCGNKATLKPIWGKAY
ncbi:MAG: proline--tRNA ligase [Bacteroidia bacterium]|nr:proline--tRNA ligase [Bacteroidia bacterium]